MVEIIKAIKNEFPDNAITLSLGERSHESYQKMYDAGADRYLLRHESASKELYESIHPEEPFEVRRNCLKDLKEIVGVGHRVLHGGEKYSNSVLITDEVIQDIKDLTKLGPLHHPGNLAGIAIAISVGGPGAIFWMWLIALIGSASSFVESTLSLLTPPP